MVEETADSATDAATLVASLDIDTKVRLLSGRGFWTLESLPEHHLGTIVVADGPHGVRYQRTGEDHVGLAPAEPATCFPTAAALGSTWDQDLLDQVGAAIGAEARALGVSVVLGPGLNIKRHPAGGRNFEYFSEDPLLGGKLAAAMVRGIQSRGVGACIKHFAVNNHEAHRLVVDAVLDERTLREIYLSGFEIAVREAAPWTVMCSYNLVNGTYASEHRELLTTVLRDEWGFEGLVMSDWGAVSDRAAGIAAGMDLEMPGSRGACDPDVHAALARGRLDQSSVDRCAQRVVELIQRAQDVSEEPEPSFEDHHQLAGVAAAAGSVLLSNDGVLPLSATARIAVIGAFASSPRYQGAGSSQVNPTQLDIALDAIHRRVSDPTSVSFCAGYDPLDGSSSPELLKEALDAAASADVVVCFVGLPAAWESEGFDRSTLDLPAGQLELIEALCATETPVVVVLNNGGVVHMGWAPRADAVLECWLGGQAGGSAVTEVLFGDAEPGGRLAESIPVHVGQLPANQNFPGAARQVEYREGPFIGYRFHDSAGVPAMFAFGHGLSYTSFEWSEPTLRGEGTDRSVSVRVTNVGDRFGSDVMQVYVRHLGTLGRTPHKELKGFAKVHLGPGESTEVTVQLDRRSFSIWDTARHRWSVVGGDYQVVLARSSVDTVETFRVELEADEPPVGAVETTRWVAADSEFADLLGRPIPTPKPTRPFNRNSTLEDLDQTRVGKALASVVLREATKRAQAEFPDPDEATTHMIRTIVREGPARGLVLMSGGAIGFDALDTLIDALNGEWAAALRRGFDLVRAPRT